MLKISAPVVTGIELINIGAGLNWRLQNISLYNVQHSLRLWTSEMRHDTIHSSTEKTISTCR